MPNQTEKKLKARTSMSFVSWTYLKNMYKKESKARQMGREVRMREKVVTGRGRERKSRSDRDRGEDGVGMGRGYGYG